MQNWINIIGWQGAVLISGVLSGVAQSIGKRQVGQMSAFQSGVLRDGTILAIMFGLTWWQGGGFFGVYSLVWIGIGLLESVMQAAYYSASREELSATVIFSYPLSSVLIVGLSGAMFGEWQYFDPRTVMGLSNIGALLLIIWMMLGYQHHRLGKTRWSTKIFLSSMMVVVSNLAAKWAVSTLGLAPSGYLVYEYVGLLAGGLAYVTLRGQGMAVGLKNVGWGVGQGILFALSVLLFVEVLRSNPLSLASLLRRVTIVGVTVLVGLIYYREGKGMKKEAVWRLGGAGAILLFMMWANG